MSAGYGDEGFYSQNSFSIYCLPLWRAVIVGCSGPNQMIPGLSPGYTRSLHRPNCSPVQHDWFIKGRMVYVIH
jgi:hypothetical protein